MELLGPSEEHLLWLKPLALQPKDTTICCGLNKMRYCILQCLTALSSFLVSHVLFTLYFACQLKHSQFLHEVAVETHPCSETCLSSRGFFLLGLLQCPFKTTTFAFNVQLTVCHTGHPAFTGMLLIHLCVLKGLLNCVVISFFFLLFIF